MSRPSSYCPEIGTRIIEQMAEGATLLEICKGEDMPSRSTVYRWTEEREDFRDKFARGRMAQAHYFFELIAVTAFDDKNDFFVDGESGKMVGDHVKVARDRLKVDSLKFLASKLLPRTYGDKPDEPTLLPSQTVRRIERVVVRPGPAEPLPEPPRQIEYKPEPPPADLAPEDWSLLRELLALIKRTIPSDSEQPPAEILDVMRKALLAHFQA